MSFNPYRKWLGIPSQIKEPTFYDILGIHPGENDDEVIRSAIEQRRVFIQNKRGQGEDESVSTILTLIDEAASTLLVPEFKNGYDRQLGLHLRKKTSGRRKSYVLPSWMESRVVRVYGEGSGIVGDLLGIVTVLFGAFALMAWFSFSLPWSKIPKSDDVADQPKTWIEKLAEGSKASDQVVEQPPVEAKIERSVANQTPTSSIAETSTQPDISFPTSKPEPEMAAPETSSFVSVDQTAVMKALQGEWLCVSTEEKGQPFDQQEVQYQDRRIEFNGDSIKMTRTINDRASYEGKFQIESSSNGFNFVGKGPRGAAVEWLGIYELNQDMLKLCYRYNRDGTAQRPTEFKTDDSTPNNSGYYTYRRVPPSKSEGWISMFDGKSPSGWKANENPSAWKIEDGCIVATGEARSYLFYKPQDGNFRDFHFKAEIKSTNGSNSGVYFHTNYVAEGVPSKGLECQVCATNIEQAEKTGSLYKVRPIKTSPVQDDEWYTQEIIVQGKRVMHKINGVPVVDYTEPKSQPAATEKFERRLGEGLFALQSSAPAAKTYFRNIQVKPLGATFANNATSTAPQTSAVDAKKQALEAMQGKWECFAGEEIGNQLDVTAIETQQRQVEVSGNSLRMSRIGNNGQFGTYIGKFQIDPESRHFDFIGKKPDDSPIEFTGIYEIENETLKLCYCYNRDGTGVRPTAFKTDQTKPNYSVFYTYRRSAGASRLNSSTDATNLKTEIQQTTGNLRIEVPKPKLYLSFDPSVKNFPANLNFKIEQNSYTKGRSGQALKFSGKSPLRFDFQLPTGNAPRSVAVWLRNDQEPKEIISVVNWGFNNTKEVGEAFGIMQSKDNTWMFFNGAGGLKSRVAIDRNWHHHCVTFDGSAIRYYLDGSQTAFDNRILNTLTKGYISLGGFTKSGPTFVGLMDELHFFGVALSNSQVAEVMKNPYGSRN